MGLEGSGVEHVRGSGLSIGGGGGGSPQANLGGFFSEIDAVHFVDVKA